MSTGGGFVQRFVRNVRASDGTWMTYPRTVRTEDVNRKRREFPDIEWVAEPSDDPGRVRLRARRLKPPTTSTSLVPHPMFIGLFEELPEPGTEFDAEAQARWLAAAAGVLRFLYGGPPMVESGFTDRIAHHRKMMMSDGDFSTSPGVTAVLDEIRRAAGGAE